MPVVGFRSSKNKNEDLSNNPYVNAVSKTFEAFTKPQIKFKTIPSNGFAPVPGDLTGKKIHNLNKHG